MAGSKYNDSNAVLQVIGCILKQPSLLDDEGRYFFNEHDFMNEFHRVMFGVVYNLRALGSNTLTAVAIEDYLEQHEKSLAVYKANNGREWISNLEKYAEVDNFDYYYNRMKKMTLLRSYDEMGMDVKFIYNPDLLDSGEQEEQRRRLDSMTLCDIADLIDEKLLEIRMTCIDNNTDDSVLLGDGILDLLNELEETPEFGTPLYGPIVNTVCRGARLKKFYLRSAGTGIGKTRTMVADICNIACDEIYDTDNNMWVKNGIKQPALYISVELELNEVQTMCLAFLSGVNEEHILTNRYNFGEKERVLYAARLLAESPLYIEIIPDFSIKDIENSIKRNIRQHKTRYIAFDYLSTSMKILEEVTRRSGGIRIREDNVLFLLSAKLKDICNQYSVFIITSTQLSGDYRNSDVPDQTLLRGAKSLGDRVDFGSILLEVNEKDLEMITPMVSNLHCQMPNVKMSVYKNRRGQYNKLYLWMVADRGTCRFKTVFATDYSYNLIHIEETMIEVSEG